MTALKITRTGTSIPKPEVVDVTPDIAGEFLAANRHNRNLRPPVVRAYAADMANGDWLFNGESVKFGEGGVLLDGQHRLAAVVQSGVTVPMVVIRDLPNTAQQTLDGGARRKFGDVLKLAGESNYTTLASSVRAIYLWELGKRGGLDGGGAQSTNAQLLACLERNPWIREGMTTVSRATAHANLPARVGGLAWWLFMNIDTEDATYFFDRLASDLAHVATEPIYELRKHLTSSTSVRGQRNATYMLAVTIKAWNKYRVGESISQLKFRAGGAFPEAFPEPE